MKKLVALFAITASLSFASQAFAGDTVADDLKGRGSYGMAGCGLGSMLFSENSMINQILAATTNGTFGTQTFGISSGTSNCTSHGVAMLNKETEMFVEVNYDVLQKEISQGKGETFNSFANLLGCSSADVLGKGLQSNYSTISTATDSNQFLENVRSTIKNDATLSTSCKINS